MPSSTSRRSLLLALALALALGLAPCAAAQDSTARPPTPGRIRGRVVEDSGGAPIAGAEVRLPALNRSVRTDSTGRYEFTGLAPESTVVHVRALGYMPDSTVVAVRNRLVVNLELRLAFETIIVTRAANPAQPLPAATTIASAPGATGNMAEFNERRRQGIGRFVDREMLAKWDNRRTGDMFAAVGGVSVRNGGMKAWISNGRANDATCVFCRDNTGILSIVSEADFAAGARPACYMDVFLDGSRVYQFGLNPPQPLFDVNSLQPSAIEGIEVYVGVAQIPAKYNTQLSSGCGVLLIWTRISPDRKP